MGVYFTVVPHQFDQGEPDHGLCIALEVYLLVYKAPYFGCVNGVIGRHVEA